MKKTTRKQRTPDPRQQYPSPGHTRKTLSDEVSFLAWVMRKTAGHMEYSAGFCITSAGKRLLSHATELRGAADIVEGWARALEKSGPE